MLNRVIIMGRITQDLEVRQTQGGTAVLSFTVAVDSLLGSVFLKINTAMQTIIKEVNVPKLHISAAIFILKNNDPTMIQTPTNIVIICGVLYLL